LKLNVVAARNDGGASRVNAVLAGRINDVDAFVVLLVRGDALGRIRCGLALGAATAMPVLALPRPWLLRYKRHSVARRSETRSWCGENWS